jgi:phage N-6-adenine-methyltransferase
MGRKLTGDKPKAGTIRTRRYRAKLKRQAKNPNGNGDEWGTPNRYVALVRDVLGTIDCDPASNEAAQQIVQAAVYYTKETSGLVRNWIGAVFLNPPYSKGLVDKFVTKLLAERAAGRCTKAIVLVNQSSAHWYHCLLSAAAADCKVWGRIKFVDAGGKSPGDPSRGQTFFYFGPDPQRFRTVFSQMGDTAPPMAAAAD